MDVIVVAILPWVFIAFGGWLAYQFLRQNGRILLRLEALDQKLERLTAGHAVESGPPPGLAVGAPAPAFELPDLAGGRTALTDLRGRALLLMFFDPRCGFCLSMAADLGRLPADGERGRPVPLVVTTGDAAENRSLLEKYGVRARVLIQQAREISALYQTTATPSGYLIDEDGRIASELAMGAAALFSLAEPRRLAANDGKQNGSQNGATANHSGRTTYKGNRSLADSRIERDGLPAGTLAPTFTLPRFGDGADVSLELYRGRRVILFFSDPECGPCDEIAPELERFAQQRPDVSVLMVSRGDADANARKIRRHGLTFPVALQPHWAVSRLYGIFATPVAYLIDARGVIAADVAVGADAVRGLLASITASPGGNAAPLHERRAVNAAS